MFRRALAIVLFAAGISVFLIRIQHPGEYAFPERGNLAAGLLSFALAAWLSFPRPPSSRMWRLANSIVLVSTPVVFFFATYATLAELEEVVVIRTPDVEGRTVSLRLWVADVDGSEWVNMPRSKATAHGLANKQVEFLRGGEWSCRASQQVDEREVVSRVNRQLSQDYAVKRFAQMIGVFGEEAAPNVVSIRLRPCESS